MPGVRQSPGREKIRNFKLNHYPADKGLDNRLLRLARLGRFGFLGFLGFLGFIPGHARLLACQG
jgi:hypothetical protein